MAINIKFDTAGNPEPPSIILATKNGNKLGLLNVNADSIELNDKLKVSEISFTLNKYVDGELNNLWDKVVDFKLVWCKEWDCWFEIKVELDEATETVKTVFGTQLGQAELSQIMVYNMEVNTEEDIARDDYKITILYDENDHEASLLHRIFKDKAPHYSIAYVDPTIARIQRQFSWDGSSICDVLDEIEEEIGCLVIYNSNSTEGEIPNRSISVYDLEQNCNDCGHRGEFIDECPKCGSKNIKYGYGEDTTIFVTNDELASDGIELVTDIDSVKNCFKLEAGDDLMTATIRNCNPNGSDYIWRFSDDIKNDMSNELVEKLESYDAEYKRYYNEYESNLDATLLTQYNNLVEKYDDFYNTDSTCLNCDNKGKFYDKCPSCNSENLLTGKELQKISTPIVGYPSLMNAYYNTIDFALYLESGFMPSITMSGTTAKEQASLLTTDSLSPVAVNVKEASSISLTTADSAVLSMAKIIVKSTYKVEILSSSLSTEKKWSGTFKITNYSDDTDTFEVVVNDIEVNNNAETFIKQKIEKALNKENTDDYSISGLFEKEYNEFCTELTKYALKPLQSFYDAADACISILTEQGAGDETNKPDLYENLYLPYFQKQEAIASEINIRKNELAIIEGVYDETTQTASGGLQNNIRNCQNVIQNALNFEDYLGEDLWKEFCSFRREDKYSNSNYISDGLNNAQLFERALEFLDIAENEIYKSSELQHSISTSLNNLLTIDKFKSLVKYFKNGNWIRVRVDDKINKLRLLEYNINFGSFENIPVEFSDVTKIKNSTTDVKNVLEQASSVASSYDAVTRQAKKGNIAKSTIEQWLDEGLNAANVQIQSNDSEEIIITKNGLLGRSYDDITGTYSPEQLKITHNIMAYTDDNWQTVRQAIGKHEYNLYNKDENKFVDEIGYGMNADFVVAGVVSGSQIIGGDIYSDNYSVVDETGSYLNLRDGTFSFGGGSLRYENGKLIISSKTADTNITEVNEEWLKTTSVYAENLKVNAAYIQEKLTATQIDTKGLIAENISSTTIDGKTITGGSIFIGDTTKVGDYAEITNDGALTCTNVNIQGGILQIGSKNNEETHTWITSDGTLNTYNANISGEIRATKGSIGGFTIETTETNEDGSKSGGWLYSGESIGTDKSIFLSATDMSGTVSNTTLANWRLAVGEHFGVASDGTAYMSNCEITGGSLKMGTEDDGYHTWISEDGVLNANGANINGIINASAGGTIAGFYIDDSSIYNGTNSLTSTVSGVYLGTDGIRQYKNANANVTISDGILNANGANITGAIYAKEGSIGGFVLSEVTDDSGTYSGLVSDTLSIMPTLIYFKTQSKLNLGDFAYLQDTDSATEIFTTGVKDFKLRNADGGGFLFKANQESQLVSKNVNLTNLKKTIDYGYGDYTCYAAFTISAGSSVSEVFATDITVTISFKYKELYGFSLRDKYLSGTFTLPAGAHSKDFVFTLTRCTESCELSWKITSHGQESSSYTTGDLSIVQTFASGTNNVVYSLGSIMPNSPNTLFLGDTSNPWKSLVVQSFTQTGSDKNIKKNIEDVPFEYEKLFDMLSPQRFKYIDGDSGRYHIGFIAQDVEYAIIKSGLTNYDFAGLCISDPDNPKNSSYTLRYEEFIALNTLQIQKLKKRVEELENKLKTLENK